MSNFKLFGTAVEARFKTMLSLDSSRKNLFIADVNGDELWDLYLSSFPEGSDPIYIENTVHDCNCCRNFIKHLGNVVFIDGDKHYTVWDTSVEGVVDEHHAVVAQAMAEFVKSKGIKSQFLVTEGAYGSGRTLQFDHFYAKVPKAYQMKDRVALGEKNTSVALLKRSVEEISSDAIETVLDLISQNSLYRGTEFKAAVLALRTMKAKYLTLESVREKEFWLWTNATLETRFRNTVIGTLLTDLSDGEGLADNKRISLGSIVRTNKGFSVKSDLLSKGSASYDKWGLSTGDWVDVDMIMKSPNHWGGQAVGNEHTFFMLKGCKNPDSVRGFYNEFLRGDMTEHRKVFELLASNMKAEYSDEQLSGVGFSSTNKREITLRLKGAINRIIKVTV